VLPLSHLTKSNLYFVNFLVINFKGTWPVQSPYIPCSKCHALFRVSARSFATFCYLLVILLWWNFWPPPSPQTGAPHLACLILYSVFLRLSSVSEKIPPPPPHLQSVDVVTKDSYTHPCTFLWICWSLNYKWVQFIEKGNSLKVLCPRVHILFSYFHL
jgi:hypothetical protein